MHAAIVTLTIDSRTLRLADVLAAYHTERETVPDLRLPDGFRPGRSGGM